MPGFGAQKNPNVVLNSKQTHKSAMARTESEVHDKIFGGGGGGAQQHKNYGKLSQIDENPHSRPPQKQAKFGNFSL